MTFNSLEWQDAAFAAMRDVCDDLEIKASGDPRLELLALDAMEQYLQSYRRLVVRTARENGVSWSEIGDAMGVSKQAAAKKFGSQ